MKKFIAFLMALLMVASLAGCKSDAPEAVVVEAGAVSGVETAEHRIVSLKYEGTAPATEGKDADCAEVTKATKVAEVSDETVAAEAVNGAVEGIGSTESTTCGGNGAGTVQPTKPTSDSGSTKPSEENGYEVIVDETEPTVPATEPTKPTGDESVPTEPTKPSEPVKPTEPYADYSEPVDPSEGETPTQPIDPCPDNSEEPTECCHAWDHHHEDAKYSTHSWIVCDCGWECHDYDLVEGGKYAGMSPGEAWQMHRSEFSIVVQLNEHGGYKNRHETTLVKEEVNWWVCVICGCKVDSNPVNP